MPRNGFSRRALQSRRAYTGAKSLRSFFVAFVLSASLVFIAPISGLAASNGQQFEFIDGYVLNNSMKSFCVTGPNQNGTRVHGCWNSTGTYTVTRNWWWVGTISMTWYPVGGGQNGPGNYGPIRRVQTPNCWSWEDDNGQQKANNC